MLLVAALEKQIHNGHGGNSELRAAAGYLASPDKQSFCVWRHGRWTDDLRLRAVSVRTHVRVRATQRLDNRRTEILNNRFLDLPQTAMDWMFTESNKCTVFVRSLQ